MHSRRFHSITSPARASTVAGSSRPSALAVLRFATSVFGRRLYWQVGRLFTLEDAIDVAGRAAVLFDFIRPVGNSLRMGGSSTPPPPLREIERNNAISPHRNSG
jgi:hypothetical protein